MGWESRFLFAVPSMPLIRIYFIFDNKIVTSLKRSSFNKNWRLLLTTACREKQNKTQQHICVPHIITRENRVTVTSGWRQREGHAVWQRQVHAQVFCDCCCCCARDMKRVVNISSSFIPRSCAGGDESMASLVRSLRAQRHNKWVT